MTSFHPQSRKWWSCNDFPVIAAPTDSHLLSEYKLLRVSDFHVFTKANQFTREAAGAATCLLKLHVKPGVRAQPIGACAP